MYQKLDQFDRRYLYSLPMMPSNKTFHPSWLVSFQREEEKKEILLYILVLCYRLTNKDERTRVVTMTLYFN